jgi:predicted dehydrogenase
MSTNIKIGIIGGGMMSQIAHLPFYLADKRCEVVAVSESRPSLVRHLNDTLKAKSVVTDHHVLLDDPSISAVIIIAPRQATGPLALAALEAGKDVLVEKPLVHTFQQATKLVNMAAEKDKLLGVAFMKRHDPGVQAAKQELARLISSGVLGQMLMARFYDYARDYAHPPPPHKRPEESRAVRFDTWPTSPDWLSGARADDYAWFMNAASHDINLLTYFFPVNELRLMHAGAPIGGGLTATFEANRTPVVFELAKSASGEWLQGAEFIFEKGRLQLEIPSPMAVDQVGRVRVNENNGVACVRELSIEKVWSFKCQARAFVGNLLERQQPLTNGVDAMKDIRLIEEIWNQIEHNEAKHAH